ncbi:AMP-dependent synthetase/ligase [Lentzea nigeriaca]|uniref:AMP-dependent synthetase/ligase n=1 Tax=Lentzea nigeriaca TaxID=1128665 RepID=UPI001959F8AF|nr:long-chain fatty acid--CoA ligase [Lentzea nigeriaca]MBM7857268.1 long-chain acyl-CoA synthetase [Lentzea nigeriaca]
MTYSSVGERFLAQCAASGAREAFRAPGHGGGWQSLTWSETADRARDLAAGLLALGVRPEQRVAIAAATRLEWVLADLAVTLAGAATTTVYPSTNAEDVDYILTDCAAVVVFAEDPTQLAKLRSGNGFVGDVHHVVLFDGESEGDAVLNLDGLAQLGRHHLAKHPDAVDQVLAAMAPEHLATIIYTSGTTGRPKGVELTHANWLYLGAAIASEGVIRQDHLQFLWLPLSHVFGKLLLAAQYEIGFVTAVDGRIDRIVDNVALIKPSFMAAAPRIFEKIYSRVMSTTGAAGGLQARIATRAFAIGIDAVRRKQQRRSVPMWQRAGLAIADRLVFAKIRARLGGNLEYLVSGSAALAPQIAEWFAAVGLPILEGYGLTETSGASFVNRPGSVRIGTVGVPLPGTQVRLADDGEILLRGSGVMRGYHNLPDQTAAVIDADGWFATGDIGELDAEGYLRITDRKKDLVKTSGGKYIAPTAIESAVKAACPLVSNAVVIADGRNFASILLTLDPDAVSAGTDPHVTVQRAIDTVNAGLNRWETVKQYRILPRELSVEAGELTPSLKIKRAVVVKNYAALVDDIYSGAGHDHRLG